MVWGVMGSSGGCVGRYADTVTLLFKHICALVSSQTYMSKQQYNIPVLVTIMVDV